MRVKGESFVAKKPRLWFGKQLANVGLAVNFDLAPDGKRLVVLMSAESPEPRETQSHITLIVNFFDEVRRRVAAQGKQSARPSRTIALLPGGGPISNWVRCDPAQIAKSVVLRQVLAVFKSDLEWGRLLVMWTSPRPAGPVSFMAANYQIRRCNTSRGLLYPS